LLESETNPVCGGMVLRICQADFLDYGFEFNEESPTKVKEGSGLGKEGRTGKGEQEFW
jgi:hypothetical protein